MSITMEMFNEWRRDPVTLTFLKTIWRDREELKELLANNASEEREEIVGRCKAVQSILNMEYEDLIGEINEQ